MITSTIINSLVEKYNAMPDSADICKDRHLDLLMDFAINSQHVDFDGDALIIINADEPLHRIEIERIIGAEDMQSHFAIFLPAAALLIDKISGAVKISLA